MVREACLGKNLYFWHMCLNPKQCPRHRPGVGCAAHRRGDGGVDGVAGGGGQRDDGEVGKSENFCINIIGHDFQENASL
jgi:hypothetical protein